MKIINKKKFITTYIYSAMHYIQMYIISFGNNVYQNIYRVWRYFMEYSRRTTKPK